MPEPSATTKHALVTGGSAGFGLALSAAYVRRGYGVTLVGRDEARLQDALARLEKLGESPNDGAAAGLPIRSLAADLSVADEGERVVKETLRTVGRLDAVCHAAGKSSRGWATQTPRSEFEELLALNFLAAVELASASADALSSARGSLVLIGSLATRLAPAGLGAYPASKHPLAALAQQYRLELGDQGHHTLLVCPGPIARDDAGQRYDEQTEGLPEALRKPGGGARVKALDPDRLAERVLKACDRRQAELVVPLKARGLFALSQLAPAWGDWLLRKQMRGGNETPE